MEEEIEKLRRKSERDPRLLRQYREACSRFTLEKVRESYIRELETLERLPVRDSVADPKDGVSRGLDAILDGDTYKARVHKIVRLQLLLAELERHLGY